jgi:hypothetical protein
VARWSRRSGRGENKTHAQPNLLTRTTLETVTRSDVRATRACHAVSVVRM